MAEAINKIDWQPGTVNVDIGGGRFDKATDWLRERGVENLVFDPFNRDQEHNRQVAERVQSEKADTVTCTNVLNVIDNEQARANVILQSAKALKPGGTAYFSIYEGNKSGIGKATVKDSWQNNRITETYIDEIKKYFNDVRRILQGINRSMSKREIDAEVHLLNDELLICKYNNYAFKLICVALDLQYFKIAKKSLFNTIFCGY